MHKQRGITLDMVDEVQGNVRRALAMQRGVLAGIEDLDEESIYILAEVAEEALLQATAILDGYWDALRAAGKAAPR